MRDFPRLQAFSLFPLPHHCGPLESGGGINGDPGGTSRVTLLAQAASRAAAAGGGTLVPGALPELPYARTRRIVSWLALGLAGAEVIVGVIAVLTSSPEAPAGWGGDVTEMFLTVVPLLAVGFALRSSRLGVARTTAVMALVFATLASLTLLGYLFWGVTGAGSRLARRSSMHLSWVLRSPSILLPSLLPSSSNCRPSQDDGNPFPRNGDGRPP